MSSHYLQSIYDVLGKIHNGRTVHKRENLRQSLGFYIWLSDKKISLNDRQESELKITILESKDLIKQTWS